MSSPLQPHSRQGIACVVVVVSAVFFGALALGNGAAAGTGKPQRPKPQNLWRSYPLNPVHHGATGASGTQTPRPRPPDAARPRSVPDAAGPRSAPAEGEASSGGIPWRYLLAALAMAGGIALLALEFRRRTPAALGPRARPRRPSLPFRSSKGESIMGNMRRKLWTRGEQAATSEGSQSEHGRAVAASEVEPRGDEAVAESTEAQPETDPAEVGAEVESVLKSAQEAAASIRRTAREEATRIREEAKSAAEAEVADAQRVRAEADAYAQQVRAHAEREAEQLREKASVRLEQADQEVEKKLREAEQDARGRREELATESERYHERLQSMLGVFQGMSSQIADLLETPDREAGGTEGEPGQKTLEEALRHYSATSGRT
jgi:F0F1-type ATP synthase membrane subunit b/b'